MALKRIILHGYLKDLFPGELRFDVRSAAEAIKAMCQTTGAFRATDGRRHKIRAIGFNTKDDLFQATDRDEIHLIPQFNVGKSPVIQIALGTVLVAAGIGLSLGGFPQAGLLVASFGLSMAAAGLSQMLAPTPERTTTGDEKSSKYLGSSANTVKIGTPIPIIYGKRRVFGHYLSVNITAKDLADA